MPYIYLFFSVLFSSSSSILGTYFNRKNQEKKDASTFYTFLYSISVFIGWTIFYAFNFQFEFTVLLYSFLFALFYICGTIGLINALKYGPTSLSSLFLGLSTILVSVWGFFFWDEKLTTLVFIGLILVLISLTLCLYTGKKSEKNISKKWILYIILTCIGNAGCSITQRTQQLKFHGEYGGMLMSFASCFACIACFFFWFYSNKVDARTMLKNTWIYPVAAGLGNLFLNYLLIVLATTNLSTSLIYPVIGVGPLFLVACFSMFAFKEKLKWWQWVGFFIGAIATLLLSI